MPMRYTIILLDQLNRYMYSSSSLSLSLYYMYTRDNGVPIGLFRQFRLDLQTCFDVLAVRSEVQTQG